jgi:hypothetical protein
MEIVVALIGIVGATTIALYATWLFTHRLRAGDRKAPAFWEWLKNLLQAVWGM